MTVHSYVIDLENNKITIKASKDSEHQAKQLCEVLGMDYLTTQVQVDVELAHPRKLTNKLIEQYDNLVNVEVDEDAYTVFIYHNGLTNKHAQEIYRAVLNHYNMDEAKSKMLLKF